MVLHVASWTVGIAFVMLVVGSFFALGSAFADIGVKGIVFRALQNFAPEVSVVTAFGALIGFAIGIVSYRDLQTRKHAHS
jgi:hypothetical protein